MLKITTDEDAEKCIEDNFEGMQEDLIKVLYRAKRQSNDDPETALVETLKTVLISSDGDVARTSATVVAEDATALARSHVEDLYLTDKKNTGQECVFVMKQGRSYSGVIKEYDDKVITLQARSAPDDAPPFSYPQDILLYRADLSTIYVCPLDSYHPLLTRALLSTRDKTYCERTNDV